jgi:O-antigen/teichoic acid export membrane protein
MVMFGATFFTTAIIAVMPTLTQNFARLSHEGRTNSLVFGLQVAALYGAACVLALAIAGQWLLRLWAGREVFPGFGTFRWQLTLLLLQVFIAPLNAVLVATTRHYGVARLHAFESALNLALSLWWVRRWGLSGVIAGTVVARLVTTAWYIPLAALETVEVRVWVAIRRLWPCFSLAWGVSATAIVFGFSVHAAIPAPTPITAGVAVAGFVVAYLTIGLKQEDRRKLISQLASLTFWIETA